MFGLAELVPGINTAADDGQPNVRSDELELFFYSTRVLAGVSQGAADLYVTTRPDVSAPWSDPVNLGRTVNSSGPDIRPSPDGGERERRSGSGSSPPRSFRSSPGTALSRLERDHAQHQGEQRVRHPIRRADAEEGLDIPPVGPNAATSPRRCRPPRARLPAGS